MNKRTKNEASPSPGPGLKAALYARLSISPEDGVGGKYSIASQLDATRDKAKALGADQILEFTDSGFSGKTLDRPDLSALRELVRTNTVDMVVVYSMDRLSRVLTDLLILRDECLKKKVRLEFVNGEYADSPEGKVAFSVQGVFAEYERAKVLERTARGRLKKAKNGFLNSGMVPFGYRYVGKAEGSEGTLVVDNDRAQIVRRIFRQCVQGMTLYGIYKALDAEGIRTARDRQWSPVAVHRVLKNPTYAGRIETPQGVVIPCPAIIDEQTFQLAQARLERNRKDRAGRPGADYLLRGLMFCHCCGTRIFVVTDRARGNFPKTHYYRCASKMTPAHRRALRAKSIPPNCGSAGCRQKVADGQTWTAIWAHISDPDELMKQATDWARENGGDTSDLQKNLDRLTRRLAEAQRVMMDPDRPVPYDVAKAEIQTLNRQIAEGRERVRAMTVDVPSWAGVRAWVAKIRANEPREFSDRRAILETLQVRLTFGAGVVYVDGSVPIPEIQTPAKSNHFNGNNSNKRLTPCENNNAISIPFHLEVSLAA